MRRLAALALVAVSLIGACSDDDDEPTAASSTTVTTASSSSSSTSGPSTTGSTVAAPGDTGSGVYVFRTPSDNIACEVDADAVRCDVRSHTWTPPPRASDCDLDWGDSLGISAAGRTFFICYGDTVYDETSPVLPYGGVVRRGDLQCRSDEAGVTCEHLPTKHRLFASREKYEFA